MLGFGKRDARVAEVSRLVAWVYPIRHGGHVPHRKVRGVDGGGELLVVGMPATYTWKGWVA